MNAKFLGSTQNRGFKFRWECPNCRENKAPECRFNLDHKKTNRKWNCRFCGIELNLIR